MILCSGGPYLQDVVRSHVAVTIIKRTSFLDHCFKLYMVKTCQISQTWGAVPPGVYTNS